MRKSVCKRMSLFLTLLLTVVLASAVAVGCGDRGTGAKEWQVKFYDGTNVITTKTVKDGEKVNKITPADANYTKDGFRFVDWFAVKDYTIDFDFNRAITSDTNVYSQWQSSAEDTRQWLIAGSSAGGGPLKTIGWNSGAISGENTNILTKVADENKFTLIINLYAGDEFQFCLQDENGDWLTEGSKAIARGGKYLKANSYMAAASGGLGDGEKNIVVGTSGNYTLTLTTDFVDHSFGKITVVRNGDAPEIVINRSAYTWYVYGASASAESDSALKDMNWGTGLTNASPYKMLRTSDNTPDGTGTWLYTANLDVDDELTFAFLTVKASGLAAEDGTIFKFINITKFNGNDAKFESKGMGGNIGVKVKGVYNFILTVTDVDGVLTGAIEVIDNADLLKSDQAWKVFGNRLSFKQITDVGGINPDYTQEEYDVYSSDLANNKFGMGTDVKTLTKVDAPTGGAAIQYSITMELGYGDFFYFCIPVKVHALDREDFYYTGGYKSTVVPSMAEDGKPAEITSIWTNNFLCEKAGNYTFTISVSADAKLSVAIAEVV